MGVFEDLGVMVGVVCLGKVLDVDEWCDSGLGFLGLDVVVFGGLGLGVELGLGLLWVFFVFGYVIEDGDM